MNIERLLCELQNSTKTIYLDSSSLIRSYPINVLSKNLARTKYLCNPQKFSTILNRFTIPLYSTATNLHNIFQKLICCIDNFKIITFDCMFPSQHTQHIITLFGSFDYTNNITSINDTCILYGDTLSVETFFKASTLIRSANLIILDDYFLTFSVGQQLLERKCNNTPIITLSSIIEQRSYDSQGVIDVFNFLISNLV